MSFTGGQERRSKRGMKHCGEEVGARDGGVDRQGSSNLESYIHTRGLDCLLSVHGISLPRSNQIYDIVNLEYDSNFSKLN
jgi:hypothetical protein